MSQTQLRMSDMAHNLAICQWNLTNGSSQQHQQLTSQHEMNTDCACVVVLLLMTVIQCLIVEMPVIRNHLRSLLACEQV